MYRAPEQLSLFSSIYISCNAVQYSPVRSITSRMKLIYTPMLQVEGLD